MFLGRSKQSLFIQKQILSLARSRTNALITGEPRVGKRLVAKVIHAEKVDKRQNVHLPFFFFSVNCSTLGNNEVTTILFGDKQKKHQRSPRTQATAPALEQSGIILIEEIGSMSIATQLELATFLESEAVRHKKDERWDVVTTQIILTSIHTLEELREEGKLLESLAQQLETFEHIPIPPLRERPEDIPVLAKHFIHEICRDLGRKELTIDQNVIDLLLNHPWKENVRELERVIERVVLYSPDKQLLFPPDIADERTTVAAMINAVESGQPIVLKDMMDLIEKRIIERTLTKFNYNQSQVAAFLGMKPQAIRYKFERLKIPTTGQRKERPF